MGDEEHIASIPVNVGSGPVSSAAPSDPDFYAEFLSFASQITTDPYLLLCELNIQATDETGIMRKGED